MRPLFETFESTVSTLSFEALRRSVIAWLNEHCSLLSLRPGQQVSFIPAVVVVVVVVMVAVVVVFIVVIIVCK